MKEFDVKKLIDNVYEVAKRQGKKMGDLEEAVGVSQGYFSRLKGKDDKASAPSVEVIAAVAAELEITVDDLLYCNYGIVSKTDRYMLDFLNKLITDSNKLNLVWKKDTEEAIVNIYRQNPERSTHPLFETGAEASKGYFVYDSEFHPYEFEDRIKPKGPFYHTMINDGKYELYLSRILYTDDFGKVGDEYELYLVECQNGKTAKAGYNVKKPVCHSMFNIPTEVGNRLQSLYLAADKTVEHVKLDDMVKNAISIFMGKEDGQ